jgi:aerotaxis receptor
MLAWAGLSSALFLAAGGFALHGMAANLNIEQLALATAVLAAGVCLIFASGWAYGRSLSGLLATATDFTRQIAAGNLGTPLAPGNPDDEIGALRFSLEATRRNLVGLARDVHTGIADAPGTVAQRAETEELRHAIEVFRLTRAQPQPPCPSA